MRKAVSLDGSGHLVIRTSREDGKIIDGTETWRMNPGAICRTPMYIKLSDETAAWCKDIAKASLPDEFVVDYVRVFDLTDR